MYSTKEKNAKTERDIIDALKKKKKHITLLNPVLFSKKR